MIVGATHISDHRTPLLLAIPIVIAYFAFLPYFLSRKWQQRERIEVRVILALIFATAMAVLILWAAITAPRLV